MGDTYPAIDDGLRRFIEAQHIFFVATAPRDVDQHVNLSPKGLDTFRVLDPLRVAYLDHHGSGAETTAHLRENGRVVVMFCAFAGPPRIVRLHGRGRTRLPGDPEWAALRAQFPPGHARAVVDISVTRISSSCGFGVPLFEFLGDRRQLSDWADRKGEAGLQEYVDRKNRRSIDGLPAIDAT